jgi:hypothetical protein
MDDFYQIKFTNLDKGEMTLQLNANTTFKEMANKYSFKTDIPIEKFGKTVFFYYQGYILDLDSDDNISSKLRQNDAITVEEKEDSKNSTIYNNNKSRRADIFLRNNSINNKYKFYSQAQTQSQSYGNSQSSLSGDIEEEDVKEEVKDLLKDMAVLGSIEKQMIESEKIKEPEKFISIDSCLNSKDEQFFILGVLAKYLEKIGTVAVIENENVTSKENENIKSTTLLQFICNGYILKHKYIFDFSLNPNRIKQLNSDKSEKNKLHTYLKKFFSKSFDVNKEDLIVTNYEKAKDLYSIILLFKSDFKLSKTKEEIKTLFSKQRQPELKNLAEFKEECIFESIRLNKLMLDKRGNNKNNNYWGYDETRGGENYYPPVGWWRYGLKVVNEYDDGNNDWLSYDNRPGEWCISYSGLSINKKGTEKQYQNEKDTKHDGNVGVGVFTSPKPELLEANTEMININGVNYKMGLMLRVNPSKIRIPQSNNNIWVIEGISEEIRPYGILLKKMD